MGKVVRNKGTSGLGKAYDQRSGAAYNREEIIQNWDGLWIHKDEIEQDPRQFDNFEFPDDPVPIRQPLPRITEISNGVRVRPMTFHFQWTHPIFELEPPANLRVYLWVENTASQVRSIPTQGVVTYQRESLDDRSFTVNMPTYTGNTYIFIALHETNDEHLSVVDFTDLGLNQRGIFDLINTIDHNGSTVEIYRSTAQLTDAYSGLITRIGL